MFKKILLCCLFTLTTQNAIATNDLEAIIARGDLETLRTMCSNSSKVRDAFTCAAKNGRQDIMKFLLTQSNGIPLPGQDGVDSAFIDAALNGYQHIMEFLVAQPNRIPLPGQDGVDWAFIGAAQHDHLDIINYILTQPNGIPLPDQHYIGMAFASAAENGRQHIMEYILTQPHGIPLPDQNAVNNAFGLAALRSVAFESADPHTYQHIMEYIIDRSSSEIPLPQGMIPQPNQETIKNVYDHLVRKQTKMPTTETIEGDSIKQMLNLFYVQDDGIVVLQKSLGIGLKGISMK